MKLFMYSHVQEVTKHMNKSKRPPPSNTKSAHPTFSVRLLLEQLEFIDRAAHDARMTRPDWLMAVALPAAAEQLGVPLPQFPEFNRRSFRGDDAMTEQAAEGLGLSKEDYVAKVLREANASVLAKLSTPPAPSQIAMASGESGSRRRGR